MEERNLGQRVLLVTDDLEVRDKISEAFGSATDLKNIMVPAEAIDYLTSNPVNVVIIDAKTTNVKVHYSEDKEITSFMEIAQYASHLNRNTPIVVLVNALLSKDGDFATKCGATLIMDRKDISLNRMFYMMKVLKKREFRTILTRDLVPGESWPVDIFHYLSGNKKYLHFLRAGEVFTEEKKRKVHSSGIRHLYVMEKDLEDFLRSLKGQSKELKYSEELASIYNKYRQLMIGFFNVSTDGSIHHGKLMLELGMDIVARIEMLIGLYPDYHTSLRELPYPRWSVIAHGINSAIYALIFGKVCGFEVPQEMAFAALVHNIGLSEVDYNVLMKNEYEFTPAEFEEYKKHVNFSIELIKKKKILLTPVMEKMIIQHHEHYDGSGFPLSLSGTLISLEGALLSVLGSFDHFNTLRDGDKARTLNEVWDLVKQHHTTTQFHKKFHPEILKRLDDFFAMAPSS